MAQKVKIVRKEEVKRRYLEVLEMDLDYQLATLYMAMQKGDKDDIKKTKEILVQIQQDIEKIKKI